MALQEAEAAILRALADGIWRNATELAELTNIHVQTVRSRLKQLAREQMLERGGWGEGSHWGQYRIRRSGIIAIHGHDHPQEELAI